MSKIVSHKVCLGLISALHASHDITNCYKFKKTLCSFKYLFPFFLFEDWVLESQLKIELLTVNSGVWNRLHKTLYKLLWKKLTRKTKTEQQQAHSKYYRLNNRRKGYKERPWIDKSEKEMWSGGFDLQPPNWGK